MIKPVIKAVVHTSPPQIKAVIPPAPRLIKGDTGTVFTPYVDADCNLSWTNDGGLDNPPTVNIKGENGDATVTPITNMEIEKLMGGE